MELSKVITVKNTSKVRREIPSESGIYSLKNRDKKEIYSSSTKNLNRRIKEHYYGILRFEYITYIITKLDDRVKVRDLYKKLR